MAIEGKVSARKRLLGQALRLAPILRERSRAAELAGQLSEETTTDLVASGLTRICQPARFGGSEQPWDVLCETSMELGKGCCSQAWTATIFAETNYLTAQFSEEAQRDVWDLNPESLVSISYSTSINAEETNGGWLVSGRCSFSTGVMQSDWSLIGVFLPIGENKSHVHCYVLISAADRRIIDNWDVSGLAGTGSPDIEFQEAFVPNHRVLDGRLAARGEAPGGLINTATIYKMPYLGFSQTALASVMIGTAKGSVADFVRMLKTKIPGGAPLQESERMQVCIAEASAAAESARLLVLGTARENMAKLIAGKNLLLGDLARSRRNAAYGAKLACQVVSNLYGASGFDRLNLENDLQRAFRDIHAASGHVSLNWDTNSIIYGRYAVGLDLEGLL